MKPPKLTAAEHAERLFQRRYTAALDQAMVTAGVAGLTELSVSDARRLRFEAYRVAAWAAAGDR